MLTEVLVQANRRSLEGDNQTKIMPSDVWMAVYNESQLRDRLQFSRVFWEGRIGSCPPE
jgi:hypothetical protein